MCVCPWEAADLSSHCNLDSVAQTIIDRRVHQWIVPYVLLFQSFPTLDLLVPNICGQTLAHTQASNGKVARGGGGYEHGHNIKHRQHEGHSSLYTQTVPLVAQRSTGR